MEKKIWHEKLGGSWGAPIKIWLLIITCLFFSLIVLVFWKSFRGDYLNCQNEVLLSETKKIAIDSQEKSGEDYENETNVSLTEKKPGNFESRSFDVEYNKEEGIVFLERFDPITGESNLASIIENEGDFYIIKQKDDSNNDTRVIYKNKEVVGNIEYQDGFLHGESVFYRKTKNGAFIVDIASNGSGCPRLDLNLAIESLYFLDFGKNKLEILENSSGIFPVLLAEEFGKAVFISSKSTEGEAGDGEVIVVHDLISHNEQKFTINDKYKQIGDFRISPDGKKLAFAATSADESLEFCEEDSSVRKVLSL